VYHSMRAVWNTFRRRLQPIAALDLQQSFQTRRLICILHAADYISFEPKMAFKWPVLDTQDIKLPFAASLRSSFN
jgi:hypothetical protein